MRDDLGLAIVECLSLDRVTVKEKSAKWTWENCWEIFRKNLVTLR